MARAEQSMDDIFTSVNSSVRKCHDQSRESLNSLIVLLQEARECTVQNPNSDDSREQIQTPTRKKTYKTLKKLFKDLNTTIQNSHQDLNKTCLSDLDDCVTHQNFDENVVLELILFCFWQSGQFEIAQKMIQESGISRQLSFSESNFRDIFSIQQSLRNHNADPCLQWLCSQEKHKFVDLNFDLKLLKFCQLAQGGESVTLGQATVSSSRDNYERIRNFGLTFVPDFIDDRFADIQAMMNSLLFPNGIPRRNLGEINWRKAEVKFMKCALKALGHPQENPLVTCFEASTTALPELSKFVSILKSRNSENIDSQLPNAGCSVRKEHHYHSTFVCPVAKVETTPDNPPMMLPCGHVISKGAMMKIIDSSRIQERAKCPTCPSEFVLEKAVEIHF
eukprot:262004_1